MQRTEEIVKPPRGMQESRTQPEPTPEPEPCGRCGAPVPLQHRFCGMCGANLTRHEEPHADRDPLIGAVIAGRYRLLAKIGAGGMGTVYKVEHIRMGKIMAMKLLHGDLSRDPSMIRRFNREARAASRLTSPYAVQVFDHGRSDGFIYLVMEFLRGRDLGVLLQELGALEPLRAAQLLLQAAQALDEAHSLGVVHRDIKPENLFLCAMRDGQETIKVLDFGLAKLAEREDGPAPTLKGTIIGTPYYMSPEQIGAGETGPPSDIYALGALTFKLLTGEPPFDARSPLAILTAHLNDPPPLLSERLPERADVLRPLDALVARAMAKRPAERYPSASAYIRALLEVLEPPLPLTTLPPNTPAVSAPAVTPAEAAETQGIAALDRRWVRGAPEHSDRISTREDWERYGRQHSLRRVGSILLTLLLLGGLGFGAWWGFVEGNLLHASVEAEPNDRTSNATPLQLGATISGAIGLPAMGARADVDFFKLQHTGAPGEVVAVSVTGVEGIDLVLEVHDLNGALLARSNRAGLGGGERIEGIAWTGAPLFASVRELWTQDIPARSAPDTPYILAAAAIPRAPGAELEPNGDPGNALPLDPGGEVTGYVSHIEDRDLYRLPVLSTEGALLRLTFQAPSDGSPLALDVVNGAGQRVSTLLIARPGERHEGAYFFAPVGKQPLHLSVRPEAERSSFQGATTPYHLLSQSSALPLLLQPPTP